MLKYQVRTSNQHTKCDSSSLSIHDDASHSNISAVSLIPDNRNTQESEANWGTLRVYMSGVKENSDYKTIRVSTQCSTRSVIDTMLKKSKICRDTNLYELYMEIKTKANARWVRTSLRLGYSSRPLELQRCHPANMSRFILQMASKGSLVRVYNQDVSELRILQSTYKSLLLAEKTSCREAIDILLSMKQFEKNIKCALFLIAPNGEAQIPYEVGRSRANRSDVPTISQDRLTKHRRLDFESHCWHYVLTVKQGCAVCFCLLSSNLPRKMTKSISSE